MTINDKTTLPADEFKKMQNRIMMTEQELLADLKHQEAELKRYKKLLGKARLELKEIIGYLPYGLEVRYQGVIVKVEGIIHNDIYNSDTGEIPLHCVKPILRSLNDMTIQEVIDYRNLFKSRHSTDGQIELVNFFHSNKIDIYNLIDRGLAVDVKTIKP